MDTRNDTRNGIYYFLSKKHNDSNVSIRKPIYKIVDKNFFTMNELTNQQIIVNNIHEWDKHFYIYKCSNDLNIVELNEDDNIYHANKRTLEKDNTLLLEYDGREIIYLKNHLKALSSPKIYILSLINYYKSLLHSIQSLSNNGLVHNHVNFDSIAVDNQDSVLLTNFSFSLNMKRKDINTYIRHFFISYEPDYIEWPPELHILSFVLTNKLDSLSANNIDSIINEIQKNNYILNTFGNNMNNNYVDESIKYFSKYVNKSFDYILTDILQYYYTWDNYALSILYLKILIGIHRSINIKNKFIISFMKLLVCNIHLNPLKRLTIDTTMEKFDCIIDLMEPADYKQIIDKLISSG